MFFRTPRFIRRFFRRRMNPMVETKAMDMKQKLAILYAIIAWNALGVIGYQMYQGTTPVSLGLVTQEEYDLKKSRPAYSWAQTFGIKKAEVYTLNRSGLTKCKSVGEDDDETPSIPQLPQTPA